MYYENSVKFCGKSLRSAKSRHPKVSKMVRQVYISQKMPSVDMILCFKKISANTIFVKKKSFKFRVIMLLKLQSFWNRKEFSMFPEIRILQMLPKLGQMIVFLVFQNSMFMQIIGQQLVERHSSVRSKCEFLKLTWIWKCSKIWSQKSKKLKKMD